jgi:SM-20-related protein
MITGFDLLEISDFLDGSACAALRTELEQASGGPATVSGAAGAVQPLVRRVTRATIPAATRAHVTRLLMARKGELERHFGLSLSACEEPQFLRYQAGDFFVAHQDGNTPLIHDDTRFRKVSAIIFLSGQSEAPAPGCYGDGPLVLHGAHAGPQLRLPVTPPPGTLLCFRAETTHEVLPVTHGERVSIVSWFR